jgi:hypothetical protein
MSSRNLVIYAGGTKIKLGLIIDNKLAMDKIIPSLSKKGIVY